MINLNDSKYDLKKVFNNGVAGVVNGVSMRVERKKPSDAENAPLYKVFMVDPMGGEFNKGAFPPKDTASDKAKDFFVREMKHLVGLVGGTLPQTIESYQQLLDASMAEVNSKCGGKLFNVYAYYGTANYPSQYIGIGNFMNITAANVQPRPESGALLQSVKPSSVNELAPQAGDLPFDAPNGTTANTGW